ncbi:MAG: branched-chain amino acid ABC transporter permease, partial [Actinomycetota bacterium]
LAQMSLSGVAAFVMARMMADGVGRGSNLVEVGGPGLPWPLAATIGIIAAVAVGLLLGLPALRIRGVQLAVVTIAAAIAIQTMFLENEELTELRAGVPAFVKTPTFFGLDIGARSARAQNENPSFAIFAVIVLCLVAFAVANIRNTGTGRRFLAVRANEGAAAAAGINVARTKLLAFGISAAIAGVGGVMLGFKQVEVSSANFPYLASLVVLAFAYLGGVTSINGGIVAGAIAVSSAIVPTVSNYYFHDTNINQYIGALGGLGLVFTAIIHPEGIAPFFQGIMRMFGNWLSRIIPGIQTIKDAYRDGRAVPAGIGLGAIVIGYQLAVFHLTIVDSVLGRMAIFALAAVVAIALLALALGGLRPGLGDVAGEGVLWARRYGPVALVGYVLGWLVWPLRVDSYSMLWMPLLGAGLALFVRSLVLRIRGGGHDAHAPPPATPPTERVVEVEKPEMETAS